MRACLAVLLVERHAHEHESHEAEKARESRNHREDGGDVVRSRIVPVRSVEHFGDVRHALRIRRSESREDAKSDHTREDHTHDRKGDRGDRRKLSGRPIVALAANGSEVSRKVGSHHGKQIEKRANRLHASENTSSIVIFPAKFNPRILSIRRYRIRL